ncbi:hypothetical protein FIM02_03060 [SAR202 cluster bacterium AD-802-E10_MRT_200m]|nr:hypothetical protein [SAR202 cluster bacterium AD-802-E10_MRT_200m]MQF83126.1 hypothetical protein [SAR202 cluster bacterium AD-802-E10_MRT_200m]
MYAGKEILLDSKGFKLPANFYSPSSSSPTLVMSHGLYASKDGEKWKELEMLLYEQEIAGLRFNYRGCGEDDGSRAEGLLSATTLSSRIEDFITALNYLDSTDVDLSHTSVVGSSFGGMVVIASEDPRVNAIMLISTPAHLPPDMPDMPDLGCDAGKYDLLQSIHRYNKPTLIIHGGNDELVPLDHAYELYEAAQNPKHIEIIPDADHSFSMFEHRQVALGLCIEWMKNYS